MKINTPILLNKSNFINSDKQIKQSNKIVQPQLYNPVSFQLAQTLKYSISFKSNRAYKIKCLEEKYKTKIEQLNTSDERKQACLQALSVKDARGNFYFPIKDVIEVFQSEEELSDEQIQNILKRDILNNKLVDFNEIKLFSSIDDDKWESIKGSVYEIYLLSQDEEYMSLENDIKEYAQGDLSIDEIYKNYSAACIFDFVDSLKIKDVDYKTRLKSLLLNKLNNGNVDSSNLEMLADLVSKDVLPGNLFLNVQKNSRVSKSVSSDLDRLYQVIIDEEPNKCIPKYKNEQEAQKELTTGEICQIQDEKYLRIKMQDNSLKEIFISPELYNYLFPPVERNCYTQGNAGHCFILAALDSIYSNPNYRYKILEMFKENDDNTLSIASGGFKNENGVIKPQNDNAFVYNTTFEHLDNYEEEFSNSCPGVKFLEEYFEKNAQTNAEKYIDNYYSLFKSAKFSNDYTFINSLKYSKSDAESIIKMIDNYKQNPEKNMVIALPSMYASFFFKASEQKQMDTDDIVNPKTKHFIEKMVNRYIDYFERTEKQEKPFIDVVPEDVIKVLLDKNYNSKLPYTDVGGHCSEIFKQFGFKTDGFLYLYEIKDILKDKKNLENKVFTVTSLTDKKDDIINVSAMHAHSMHPVEKDNEIKYIVRNPHNTSQEFELDINELFNHFHIVEMGY